MNPGGGGESMISAAYLRSTRQIEIKPFQPNSTCQSKVKLEYLNPLSFANFHFIITSPWKDVAIYTNAERSGWKSTSELEPPSVIVNRFSESSNRTQFECNHFWFIQRHTRTNQHAQTPWSKPQKYITAPKKHSCLSEQLLFVNATRFSALITVVDIAKLPTVP